jgi:hypothetical protein
MSYTNEDEDDKKYTELLQKEIQGRLLNQKIHENDDIFIETWENYYNGNSPLSMSSNNSEIGEEDIFENKFEIEYSIEKEILDNDCVNKYVNELELLINYIRGQKKVYLYSNFVMHSRFRFLTITSILFTASISVFTPLFGTYEWCMGLIVILNALTTMMISIINQLKLESSADIYQNIAIQYENIEKSLELKNDIIIFMEDGMQKKEIITTKIGDIESELMKIKESDKIEIPMTIKHEFPLSIHLNIISFIKKMHVIKKSLIEKFMKTKKEAKYILKKSRKTVLNAREAKRFQYLTELKESIKNDLNHCINAYDYINDLITREINMVDFKQWWFSFFRKTDKNRYSNPIVDDYIKFITQP